MLTLIPSAARVAGTLTFGLTPGVLAVAPSLAPVRASGIIKGANFILDVTAAATDAGDTLDVYLQSSMDGGTTWDDWIHFTQVLGNGGPKKVIAEWNRAIAPESELHAPADATLAAGVKQGPVGPEWRAKSVVVDAGTLNVSFTWALYFEPFYL